MEMETIRIWFDNIAKWTGYIVLGMFLFLMFMMLIICWREKYLKRKYRRSSIKVPYEDYQQSKLGYTNSVPVAFIIVDGLSDEELFTHVEQLSTKYDVYGVLLDSENNGGADKYLEFMVNVAAKKRIKIKRFIFNMPDGINYRTGYYKERVGAIQLDENLRPVDDGEFREVYYTYYTLYTKKGE